MRIATFAHAKVSPRRYEIAKRNFHASSESKDMRNLLAGAAAGVLSLTATNAIWVARTQQFLHYADSGTPMPSMGKILTRIYAQEGVRGLFRVRFLE